MPVFGVLSPSLPNENSLNKLTFSFSVIIILPLLPQNKAFLELHGVVVIVAYASPSIFHYFYSQVLQYKYKVDRFWWLQQ